MRLIDIEDISLLKTIGAGRLSAKAVWRLIKAQPTVDAVPVVRCKDCRWGRETCGNIECQGEYHSYDWFCPNGKRREE